MSTYVERVHELFGNAEGQKKFIDWLNGGTTQLMLLAAREISRYRSIEEPDATKALYRIGKIDGADDILEFLNRPWRGPGELGTGLHGLKPTYGSQTILKEAGYAKATSESATVSK